MNAIFDNHIFIAYIQKGREGGGARKMLNI